ncbi:hypothetical protein BpHYR1_020218 [Brachionus plicatilis]|uniref:Uncharacterized protein n=1 Tax=Brachionus plicatilis TaxID=10195 RepID=A0A3M7RIA4_BRAPC|nr:hypothetical protein BpHYR1_020218 [Brachionus plicatilis]
MGVLVGTGILTTVAILGTGGAAAPIIIGTGNTVYVGTNKRIKQVHANNNQFIIENIWNEKFQIDFYYYPKCDQYFAHAIPFNSAKYEKLEKLKLINSSDDDQKNGELLHEKRN